MTAQALFAVFVLFALVAVGHAVALRLLPRAASTLRWCAALTTSLWLASGIFHALLPLSAFDRPTVAAVLSCLLIAVHVTWSPWRDVARALARDGRRLRRLARALRTRAPATAALLLLLAVAGGLTSVETALRVPDRWDTLTYHYTKAGLWVQSGGPIALHPPGGFAAYAHRMGGGELLDAWAMLPLHGDLLAPVLGLLWWPAIALALLALGAELGVGVRPRMAAAVFGCTTPALWGLVGTGYVEPVQALTTLLGAVFGVRYLRLRGDSRTARRTGPLLALALVAFSLAVGIKISSAPLLVVAVAFGLFASLRPAAGRRREQLAWLAAGLLAGAVAWAPWLAWNVAEHGRLFAFPLRIGPWALGGGAAMEWFLSPPSIRPYTWRHELRTLGAVFGPPLGEALRLSLLWLPPLLLAPLALRPTRGASRVPRLFLLALGLATLAAFYQPGFRNVRLGWAMDASRYLLPGLLPLLPLSTTALARRGRTLRVYEAYLYAAAAAFAAVRLAHASSLRAALGLVLASALLLLATVSLRSIRRAAPRAAAAALAAVLLPLAAISALHAHREQVGRIALLERQLAEWRRPERYWLEIARIVDRPDEPLRIAVTGGEARNPDQWFLHPLLGSRLQNELRYVAITPGPGIEPMGPSGSRAFRADYALWLERLREQGITHVVSFMPLSIEQGWMQAHPEHFDHLAGSRRHWGVFAVRQDHGTAP